MPHCDKRGLSRTISTILNAKILILLTIGASHVQKKVDIGKHKKNAFNEIRIHDLEVQTSNVLDNHANWTAISEISAL